MATTPLKPLGLLSGPSTGTPEGFDHTDAMGQVERGGRSALFAAAAADAAKAHYEARQRGDLAAAAQHEVEYRDFSAQGAAVAPRVSSVGDVKNLSDAGAYTGQMIGAIPLGIAKPVVGGTLGALAAKAISAKFPLGRAAQAVGGAIGALGAMYGDTVSSAAEQHYVGNDQQSPADILSQSKTQALKQLAPFALAPAQSLGARMVVGRGVLPAAEASLGTRIGTGLLHESGSEALSARIGQREHTAWNPTRDTSRDNIEVLDSAISGAVEGALTSGPGWAAEKAHAVKDSANRAIGALAHEGVRLAPGIVEQGMNKVKSAMGVADEAITTAAEKVDDAWANRPTDTGRAVAEGVGATVGKAQNLYEDLVRDKSGDFENNPEIADLIVPFESGSPKHILEQTAKKHASAAKFAAFAEANPNTPLYVKEAVERYQASGKKLDDWFTSGIYDAANSWNDAQKRTLSDKSFIETLSASAGTRSADAMNGYDEARGERKYNRPGKEARYNALYEQVARVSPVETRHADATHLLDVEDAIIRLQDGKLAKKGDAALLEWYRMNHDVIDALPDRGMIEATPTVLQMIANRHGALSANAMQAALDKAQHLRKLTEPGAGLGTMANIDDLGANPPTGSLANAQVNPAPPPLQTPRGDARALAGQNAPANTGGSGRTTARPLPPENTDAVAGGTGLRDGVLRFDDEVSNKLFEREQLYRQNALTEFKKNRIAPRVQAKLDANTPMTPDEQLGNNNVPRRPLSEADYENRFRSTKTGQPLLRSGAHDMVGIHQRAKQIAQQTAQVGKLQAQRAAVDDEGLRTTFAKTQQALGELLTTARQSIGDGVFTAEEKQARQAQVTQVYGGQIATLQNQLAAVSAKLAEAGRLDAEIAELQEKTKRDVLAKQSNPRTALLENEHAIAAAEVRLQQDAARKATEAAALAESQARLVAHPDDPAVQEQVAVLQKWVTDAEVDKTRLQQELVAVENALGAAGTPKRSRELSSQREALINKIEVEARRQADALNQIDELRSDPTDGNVTKKLSALQKQHEALLSEHNQLSSKKAIADANPLDKVLTKAQRFELLDSEDARPRENLTADENAMLLRDAPFRHAQLMAKKSLSPGERAELVEVNHRIAEAVAMKHRMDTANKIGVEDKKRIAEAYSAIKQDDFAPALESALLQFTPHKNKGAAAHELPAYATAMRQWIANGFTVDHISKFNVRTPVHGVDRLAKFWGTAENARNAVWTAYNLMAKEGLLPKQYRAEFDARRDHVLAILKQQHYTNREVGDVVVKGLLPSVYQKIGGTEVAAKELGAALMAKATETSDPVASFNHPIMVRKFAEFFGERGEAARKAFIDIYEAREQKAFEETIKANTPKEEATLGAIGMAMRDAFGAVGERDDDGSLRTSDDFVERGEDTGEDTGDGFGEDAADNNPLYNATDAMNPTTYSAPEVVFHHRVRAKAVAIDDATGVRRFGSGKTAKLESEVMSAVEKTALAKELALQKFTPEEIPGLIADTIRERVAALRKQDDVARMAKPYIRGFDEGYASGSAKSQHDVSADERMKTVAASGVAEASRVGYDDYLREKHGIGGRISNKDVQPNEAAYKAELETMLAAYVRPAGLVKPTYDSTTKTHLGGDKNYYKWLTPKSELPAFDERVAELNNKLYVIKETPLTEALAKDSFTITPDEFDIVTPGATDNRWAVSVGRDGEYAKPSDGVFSIDVLSKAQSANIGFTPIFTSTSKLMSRMRAAEKKTKDRDTATGAEKQLALFLRGITSLFSAVDPKRLDAEGEPSPVVNNRIGFVDPTTGVVVYSKIEEMSFPDDLKIDSTTWGELNRAVRQGRKRDDKTILREKLRDATNAQRELEREIAEGGGQPTNEQEWQLGKFANQIYMAKRALDFDAMSKEDRAAAIKQERADSPYVGAEENLEKQKEVVRKLAEKGEFDAVDERPIDVLNMIGEEPPVHPELAKLEALERLVQDKYAEEASPRTLADAVRYFEADEHDQLLAGAASDWGDAASGKVRLRSLTGEKKADTIKRVAKKEQETQKRLVKIVGDASMRQSAVLEGLIGQYTMLKANGAEEASLTTVSKALTAATKEAVTVVRQKIAAHAASTAEFFQQHGAGRNDLNTRSESAVEARAYERLSDLVLLDNSSPEWANLVKNPVKKPEMSTLAALKKSLAEAHEVRAIAANDVKLAKGERARSLREITADENGTIALDVDRLYGESRRDIGSVNRTNDAVREAQERLREALKVVEERRAAVDAKILAGKGADDVGNAKAQADYAAGEKRRNATIIAYKVIMQQAVLAHKAPFAEKTNAERKTPDRVLPSEQMPETTARLLNRMITKHGFRDLIAEANETDTLKDERERMRVDRETVRTYDETTGAALGVTASKPYMNSRERKELGRSKVPFKPNEPLDLSYPPNVAEREMRDNQFIGNTPELRAVMDESLASYRKTYEKVVLTPKRIALLKTNGVPSFVGSIEKLDVAKKQLMVDWLKQAVVSRSSDFWGGTVNRPNVPDDATLNRLRNVLTRVDKGVLQQVDGVTQRKPRSEADVEYERTTRTPSIVKFLLNNGVDKFVASFARQPADKKAGLVDWLTTASDMATPMATPTPKWLTDEAAAKDAFWSGLDDATRRKLSVDDDIRFRIDAALNRITRMASTDADAPIKTARMFTETSAAARPATVADAVVQKAPLNLDKLTRADLKANPDKVFIFGDNEQRKGLGGQANAMRGEPNAIGIATKRVPSRGDDAYWSDADFERNKRILDADFKPAFEAKAAGKEIVVPKNGIGGGLSELGSRAPRTLEYINQQLALLRENPSDNSASTTTKATTSPTLHSGGAIGADHAWGVAASKYGVAVNHYMGDGFKTPHGNTVVSTEQMKVGLVQARKAAKQLGRSMSTNEYVTSLLSRNWAQVDNSDAVFAVSDLLAPSETGKATKSGTRYMNKSGQTVVDGGTGYAVQMAINEGKPVYVFHQGTSQNYSHEVGWYKYDHVKKAFVKTEQPELTDSFAGIGTREINQKGVAAINAIVSAKFSSSSQPSPTSGRTGTVLSMNYRDGTNGMAMRPEFKGRSTMDLIASGDRTATTRSSLSGFMGIKKGDEFEVSGSDGKHLRVVATTDPYPVRRINRAEWSKLEGWDESVYDTYSTGHQMQYKLVDNDGAVGANTPNVNVWAGTGENKHLSNLAPRAFTFEGRKYDSVEQAYQSLKSGQFNQAVFYQFTGTQYRKFSGGKAGENAVELMEKLMLASFKQNPAAAKRLLATGDARITHTQDKGVWANLFPRILMDVRTTLADSSAGDGAGRVVLPNKSPYAQKDQAKSDLATQFIGYGLPSTSTAAYRRAWGDRANTGVYTSADKVFVSVNGDRAGRVSIHGDGTASDVAKAIKAGAEIITDNAYDRARQFNVGERELATFIASKGYVESPKDSGHWVGDKQVAPTPEKQNTSSFDSKLSRLQELATKPPIENGLAQLSAAQEWVDTAITVRKDTVEELASDSADGAPTQDIETLNKQISDLEKMGDKLLDAEVSYKLAQYARDEAYPVIAPAVRGVYTKQFKKMIAEKTGSNEMLGRIEQALAGSKKVVKKKADVDPFHSLADVELEPMMMLEDNNSQMVFDPPSEEKLQEMRDSVKRRFGETLHAEFLNASNLGRGSNEGWATTNMATGSWNPTKNLISVALLTDRPELILDHESFHAFFGRLFTAGVLTEKMRETLLKTVNSDYVKKRLDNLFPSTGVQNVAPKDADDYGAGMWAGATRYEQERMANMFAMWRAGALKLAPAPASIFHKILNGLRGMLGILRDDQKAELILKAFDEGKMVMPEAAAKLYDDIHNRQRFFEQINAFFSPFVKTIQRAGGTTEGNLNRGANPIYEKIRRQFKRAVGEGGQQGYLDAKDQMMKRLSNLVAKPFRDLEPSDVERLAYVLHGGFERPNTAIWRAKEAIMGKDGIIENIDRYMAQAGVKVIDGVNDDGSERWVPIKHVPGGIPKSLRVSDIMSKPDEFIADLYKHNADEMRKFTDDLNLAIGGKEGVSQNDVAKAIVSRVINSFGQLHVAEVTSYAAMSPLLRAVNSRSMSWVSPEVYKVWGENDVAKTLTSYASQAVKLAESVRRFGNGNAQLHNALNVAFGQVLAKNLEESMGVSNLFSSSWEDVDDARKMPMTELIKERLENKLPNYDVQKFNVAVARASKVARDAGTDVAAMQGVLGYDINPTLRKAQNSVLVYQNMRSLSTALFSQFIDPLNLIVRGATMTEAWSAYKRGMREVVASIKGEEIRDLDLTIAEHVGTVDAHGFLAAYGQLYSSEYMGSWFKKANDILFRYNGMEGFNRGMQVSATRSAINFIKRHTEKPGKNSASYLAELGLRAEKVKIDEKTGELDYDDPKIRQAIHQWVSGAVMRPNASQRPAWASDPHYMVFWHMKQFAYSFHDTVIKRAMYDFKKYGDSGPLGVLATAFAPVMIVADMTKSILLTGDSPTWWKAGLPEIIEHGVNRAGLTGRYQPVVDIATTPSRSWLGLGGPMVEQVQQMSEQSFGTSVVSALPGQNVIRQTLGIGGVINENVSED